jgi:hypothetical protein
MAKDKQSFLLYTDLIHLVSKLPNEKAGELFKFILSYVNDEDPITEDILIQIAFEPIKQSLKRDLVKYEKICNRNKDNGSKGGRPKLNNNPKKPTRLIKNPSEPKKADSDNDSDSDSDSVIDNDIDNDIIKINKSDLEISLEEFYNFRKEMKKPILNASKQLFLDKLYKLSYNDEKVAINILKQSIANGWQGIFELKNENNGKQQTNSQAKQHPLENIRNLAQTILGGNESANS